MLLLALRHKLNKTVVWERKKERKYWKSDFPFFLCVPTYFIFHLKNNFQLKRKFCVGLMLWKQALATVEGAQLWVQRSLSNPCVALDAQRTRQGPPTPSIPMDVWLQFTGTLAEVFKCLNSVTGFCKQIFLPEVVYHYTMLSPKAV